MNDLTDEQRKEFWLQAFENQKESGLTKTDYCRQNNIPEHRFYYWQRRLNSPSESSGGFARIEIVDSNQNSGISLVLAGGVRAELSSDFNESALRRFISAVS